MNFEIWSTVGFGVLHILVAIPDRLRVEGSSQLESHGEFFLAPVSSFVHFYCDILIVDFLRRIDFAATIVPNISKSTLK